MPTQSSNHSPLNEWSSDHERELVERARDGDSEAMGLLYDAYLPRLYRYCLNRVSDETDAEDLAEEIFVKVLGAIGSFEWRSVGQGQRIPFGAWLFRIARNHITSFHRTAARRNPTAELSESLRDGRRGPEELTETKIMIEEVFEAVRQLPDAQREVVLLRFASGLTVAETAEVLGKRQPNVKVLQHKGVKRLKQLLLNEPIRADEPERQRRTLPWTASTPPETVS